MSSNVSFGRCGLSVPTLKKVNSTKSIMTRQRWGEVHIACTEGEIITVTKKIVTRAWAGIFGDCGGTYRRSRRGHKASNISSVGSTAGRI
jgi:hypothetical protein